MKSVPLVHNPVTIVDDDDYDATIAAGPWHFALCDNHVYATRTVDGEQQRLHTFLTGWPLVDHRDGNGLNNTRKNMRPATPGQNGANQRRSRLNTSGFKGVSRYGRTGRWRAYITKDKIHHHLGYFDSAEAGARAYDAMARELFGEYARLNFPEGTP